MRSQLKNKERAVLEATLELINNSGFHASSMAKIAKMANVAPATIYLYFKNKQDLINKLYIYIKREMSHYAFENYDKNLSVKEGFKLIWNNIAHYKTTHIKEAMFLSICDISPMVDEESKTKGLKHLSPLVDLCIKGQKEGILKDYSLCLLYAFAINPLSYLISEHQDNAINLDKNVLKKAYEMAWDSISIKK